MGNNIKGLIECIFAQTLLLIFTLMEARYRAGTLYPMGARFAPEMVDDRIK